MKNRFKYIALSADHYLHMIKNNAIMDKVLNPLPNDARFIRGGNDAMGNIFLVIESAEFDEVDENDEIPFYGHLVFQKAFSDTAAKN